MATRRRKLKQVEGVGFLELVREVAAKLAARQDIFDVGALSVGAPLTEEALLAIEQQLGVRLPAVLRSLYREVSSLSFAWSLRRGEEDRLGYDNESGPVGCLELVAAGSLPEEWTPARAGAPRVLCITADGHGDGFALAFDAESEPAVVWYTHDDSPAIKPAHATVGEWLAAWAASGFINRGDSDNLEAFLAKGKTYKVERDKPSRLRPVGPATRKRKSALLATPSLAALGDGVVDLTKHREQVFAFAPLADGERCVSGSNDGALHISDLRTGRLLQKLRAGGHIQCIAVHPNGRDFISGGWSDLIIWNLESGQGRRPEGDSHATNQAVIHPDGERLLTLGGYAELKVWSLAVAHRVTSRGRPTCR